MPMCKVIVSCALFATAVGTIVAGQALKNKCCKSGSCGKKKAAKKSTKVVTVALTGGPCGGKSSCLSKLQADLKGVADIYTVPEVPTILLMNGCQFPGFDGSEAALISFEVNLIKLQLEMENSFIGIAESTGRPSLVVCDRGAMDVSAYLPREYWLKVLKAMGETEESLAERYSACCHLVTAADGAEKFYTTDNNEARTETADVARVLDKKILEAWKIHKNRAIVDNASGSFDSKIKSVVDFIVGEVKKACV